MNRLLRLPTTAQEAKTLVGLTEREIEVPFHLHCLYFVFGRPERAHEGLVANRRLALDSQVVQAQTCLGLWGDIITYPEPAAVLPKEVTTRLEREDTDMTRTFAARSDAGRIVTLLRVRNAAHLHWLYLHKKVGLLRHAGANLEYHQRFLAAHECLDNRARDVALALAEDWSGTTEELLQTARGASS